MFDTATLNPLSFQMRPTPVARPSSPRQPVAAAAPSTPPGAPAIGHWLAAALDELDYGIVLLLDDLHVSHINDAAAVELDEAHPLAIAAGQLGARSPRDTATLHEAIAAAAGRGIRRLLTLGEDGRRASVSVVPLDAADAGKRAVLVVLEKRSVCESLSVHGFARSCGLTGAETRVLVALCSGSPPSQTAEELGVAVSTVRSQIGSIRQKTGAASIRALVRQVAVLPPVKGVLRKMGRPESSVGALRPA